MSGSMNRERNCLSDGEHCQNLTGFGKSSLASILARHEPPRTRTIHPMNFPRTLIVEGWRAIPHSYAIVNTFQCLEFLKEPNLTLRHVDLPFYAPV